MHIINKTQKWKGYFTYEAGYEVKDQFETVSFSMELTVTDNSFTGTSIDDEFKKIHDKPASVVGFFDDEKMSFILKYPCSYYIDEGDNIILDKTNEHPDIHYLGFFEVDKKIVLGKWEMKIFKEKHNEDLYIEESANGEFEITRIS